MPATVLPSDIPDLIAAAVKGVINGCVRVQQAAKEAGVSIQLEIKETIQFQFVVAAPDGLNAIQRTSRQTSEATRTETVSPEITEVTTKGPERSVTQVEESGVQESGSSTEQQTATDSQTTARGTTTDTQIQYENA
jgi:hypothetical protein